VVRNNHLPVAQHRTSQWVTKLSDWGQPRRKANLSNPGNTQTPIGAEGEFQLLPHATRCLLAFLLMTSHVFSPKAIICIAATIRVVNFDSNEKSDQNGVI
jgi:hypothetical protein